MNDNDVIGISVYNGVCAELAEAKAKAAEYLLKLTISQGKLLRAEKKIEELEEDKNRLDWLEEKVKLGYFWEFNTSQRGFVWLTNSTTDGSPSARAAIDSARQKEEKT